MNFFTFLRSFEGILLESVMNDEKDYFCLFNFVCPFLYLIKNDKNKLV